MPFKDPEDRRRYDRERKRRLRAQTPEVALLLAAPERIRVAEDVEAVLTHAMALAIGDPKARGVERARTLGYLCSIALRLIEARELQGRLEALEQVLGITSRVRRAG